MWSGHGHGLRNRGRALRQSQLLAHARIELCENVFIVLQELLGILAALTDPLTLVAQPRPDSSRSHYSLRRDRSDRLPSRSPRRR